MSMSPAQILLSQLLRQHYELCLVKVHDAPGTLWLRVWWRPLDAGKMRDVTITCAQATGLLYDTARNAVKIPRAMAMDIPDFLVRSIANHVTPGKSIAAVML
jgi:hypothetical protein